MTQLHFEGVALQDITLKVEDMAEKTYDEMSMRQKGLIDAIALNRVEEKGLTNDEIVELAHELTGEKKYASSGVSRMRGKVPEVIEERVQVISNDRDEEGNNGKVTTVGDPMRQYTGPEGGIDATMQAIQERPVKSSVNDEPDPERVCPGCGESFENPQSFGGHKATCEPYQSQKDEEEAEQEPETQGNVIDFQFDSGQAFDLIRTADEEIAKQVFQQLWQG